MLRLLIAMNNAAALFFQAKIKSAEKPLYIQKKISPVDCRFDGKIMKACDSIEALKALAILVACWCLDLCQDLMRESSIWAENV